MEKDPTPKKQPLASDQVALMLGLKIEEVPGSLPVLGEKEIPAVKVEHTPTQDSHITVNKDIMAEINGPDHATTKGKAMALVRAAGPYLIVFAVAAFLYYFFFTNSAINVASLVPSFTKNTTENVKQTALTELQQQSLADYQRWIATFYYDVTERKVLDPEADNSGNGLTNFQKYLLNLNPRSYDTLGLGRADSESLAMGINPLTGNPLNEKQRKLLEQYFDMETIMNKLTLAHLQNSFNVAGAQTAGNFGTSYTNFGVPTGSAQASSGPVSPRSESPAFVTITPTVTERINAEEFQIDTNIPGRLEVPSLGINAPLIWTVDTKNFDKDLQKGVVHYPGTAMPGQIGTTYISGHSSNYVWAKGDYNHVFTHLDQMKEGTAFKVTVVQKNGRDAIFNYVVSYSKEYKPTDQEQFRNSGKSTVALSTCWPVGSTAKRLVVFGVLTSTEKK